MQGTDLYLFELPDKPAGSLGSIRPMCRAVSRDFNGADIACLEFSGASDRPLQFAAGLRSGQAVVSAFSLFDAAERDRDKNVHMQLVLNPFPSQSCVCNTVAWNQVQPGRLLTVLGSGYAPSLKGNSAHANRAPKSDHPAVYVWDVSRHDGHGGRSLRDYLAGGGFLEEGGDLLASDRRQPRHSIASSDSDSVPSALPSTAGAGGLGSGDKGYGVWGGGGAGLSVVQARSAVCSLVHDEAGTCGAWMLQSGQTLALGCRQSLRFLDLRVPKGQVSKMATPVALLASDPLEETRLATYSGERGDVTYKIWDWRMQARPLAAVAASASATTTGSGGTQPPGGHVVQQVMTVMAGGLHTHALQWSGTRRGLLTALVSSATRFRVSGFGFRVSGFGFRVSGFGFRVSGFGHC
jgi:hypothetical protein